MVGFLGGVLDAQPPQLSTPLTESQIVGRAIFQTRCAMCHVGQDPATEFQGNGDEAAPARQTTFGPLLSKAQAADEARLRDKITNGGPRMPAYRYALTDEQIGHVVAFIKTIERPMTKLAAAEPGE